MSNESTQPSTDNKNTNAAISDAAVTATTATGKTKLVAGGAVANIIMVPVDRLKQGTNHGRYFEPSEEAWAQFKSNLKTAFKNNMVDPIYVSKANSKGIHTVIAGHQRFRAAIELGVKLVPVRLTGLDADSPEAKNLARQENVNRHELSLMEVARMAKDYAQENGVDMTKWWMDKATRDFVKVSRTKLAMLAKMTDLSPKVQEMVHEDLIGTDVINTLKALTPEMQEKLVKAAILEKETRKENIEAAQAASGTATGKKTGKKKARKARKVTTQDVAAAAGTIARTEPTEEHKRIAAETAAALKRDKERKAEAAKNGASVDDSRIGIDDIYLWADNDLRAHGNPHVRTVGEVLVRVIEGKVKLAKAIEMLVNGLSQ